MKWKVLILKNTIEDLLVKLAEHLEEPATLCIIGRAASILAGQPTRQTPGIDVWIPHSIVDVGYLKRACEDAGLLYDPQGDVDPDAVYLKVIRPGIVSLPPDFTPELIGRIGRLTLVIPPPEVLLAATIVRGRDTDIEDAVWLTRSRDLSFIEIQEAVANIPSAVSREAAKTNLLMIQMIVRDSREAVQDNPGPHYESKGQGDRVRRFSQVSVSGLRTMATEKRSLRTMSVLAEDALIKGRVFKVLAERDFELFIEIVKTAQRDADPALALHDPARFRQIRNAVTEFHLKGLGNLDLDRIRTIVDAEARNSSQDFLPEPG